MSQLNALQQCLYAACLRKSRKCYVSGCHQPAIASHLLQRRGVLDQLARNGHLYEVAFRQFPSGRFVIRKRGWNDALTFQGFCAAHDASIFARIEQHQPDFSSYETRLLLSYRALLHEYREKEIMIDYLDRFCKAVQFSAPQAMESIQTMLAADTLLSWDLEYLMNCLDAELKQPTNAFHFTGRSLRRLEICTSIAYSHTSIGETFLTDPPDLKKKLPTAAVLLHLIPTATNTQLILGYHETAAERVAGKLALFGNMEEADLLKSLSDVLIKSCDTWACSEKFYLNFIKPQEHRLFESMNYFVRSNQFSTEVPEPNIFSAVSAPF